MKTRILILSGILLLSFRCANVDDFSKDDNSTKDYKIVQVLDNEPVVVRKHILTQEEMDYQEIPDSFAFELQPQWYVGTGISEFIIPSIRIPDEYRMEGISATISGNITDRLAGHSEPNARFRPYNIIELIQE
jgi:hypothetical protein